MTRIIIVVLTAERSSTHTPHADPRLLSGVEAIIPTESRPTSTRCKWWVSMVVLSPPMVIIPMGLSG
jgi:hypothetical protein